MALPHSLIASQRCLECVDNHLAADPTIADEHDMSGDEEEYEEGSASESLTNVNSQNDVDVSHVARL